MEVKDLTQSQKANKLHSPESFARDYFESPEHQIESSGLKYLQDSANLLNCEEKTESGILKDLNKRISMGVPYTSIGKDLIAINCDFPGSWYFNKEVKSNNLKSKPHPYSISQNAYSKLKETQENQVITMLGSCGAGKTFNAIHVLDHLIKLSTEDFMLEDDLCLNLFENMHKSIQLLHIMASVCKKRNLESTTCAFDISLSFDSNFRCTGGNVSASLLDISLPSPKKGRTYQILHSLMYCDPNTIKILGLSPKLPHKIYENTQSDLNFVIFDTEVNQRFFECLSLLDITLPEKKSFLEVLTSVINLFEVEFIRKGKTLEPKNRWVLRKICKSLGIAENVFCDKFCKFVSKEECEARCKDLGRCLYSKVFDWLACKVNKRLKRISECLVDQRKMFLSRDSTGESSDDLNAKYSINILDFPGFNKEKTLGGLIKNLAFESLNYYCSGNHMKLMQQLSNEKIRIQGMKESKCKQVIEFFLQENSVLSSLFAGDKEFKSTWQKVRTLQVPDLFHFVSDDEFLVEFTNGTVRYSLKALRSSATQIFFNDFHSEFLKACSLDILNKKTTKTVPKLEEIFTASLRKILFPYLDQTPFIIYCLKSESRGINKSSVQFLRNSTVIPNLLWSWFGFSHWLRSEDVGKELGLTFASPAEIKQELIKKFGWKSVQTSENFFLLKTSQMNDFKSFINRSFKTPDSTISDISMSLSLFSLAADQDFQYTVHEDSTRRTCQANKPTLINHSFTFIDIEKVPDDCETLTQATSKSGKSKNSLNGSFNDSVILMKPNSKPQVLRTVNYAKIDYSACSDQVLKIQKIWRGWKDRVYVETLKDLHQKAALIQAAWKGFLVRKNYGPVLVYQRAAFIIQKHWKLYCIRKKIAARVIQKWFRRITHKKSQKSSKKSYPSSHKMLKDNINKHANRLKQKIEKKIKSSKNPSILEDTQKALNQLKTKKIDSKNETSDQFIKKNSSNNPNESQTWEKSESFGHSSPSLKSSTSKPNTTQINSTSKSPNSSFTSFKSYSSSLKNPEKAFKNIPKISKNSQNLAEKKLSQFSDLSLVDRFKILEANRMEKIHKMRQEKLEAETFSHVPAVHKNEMIRNSFAERQEKYLKNAKAKIEQIQRFDVKEEFQFSPNISKCARSRSPSQTVNELYRWAKLKDKKIDLAREEKRGKEESQMGRYRIGDNSLAYSLVKKFKVQEGAALDEHERNANSPYWPKDS